MTPDVPEFIQAVLENYPIELQPIVLRLRMLVFEAASETVGVDVVEETLKWGQPSYLSPRGSTLRLGIKKSSPPKAALFVHCQSKLMETFKELYGNRFDSEGKRALLFNADEALLERELKQCIALSLTYHDKKHLPLLGLLETEINQ